MALNFTGRELTAPEAPPARSRVPVMVVACFAIAAMLAGLVFLVSLRQHKAEAPPPSPPLVGGDRAAPARAPAVAVTPAPAWIEHKAAPVAIPAPAPVPTQPSAADRAVEAKARMLGALRQVPHGAITLSVEDDPVAQAYGKRLRALFREAGWSVEETSSFGSGPPRQGVAAALGDSPADQAVRQAFDAIGFQFLPPPADAGVTRAPELFVGVPPSAAPAPPSPAPSPVARR